jgi:hypothetical protein
MATAADQASEARAARATIEGYLALAIVVGSFVMPSVDHPSDDSVIDHAVGAGIAFGLAVGGARFGKGYGRLAARVVLGLLSVWLLILVAVSLVRWEQVVWYWRDWRWHH